MRQRAWGASLGRIKPRSVGGRLRPRQVRDAASRRPIPSKPRLACRLCRPRPARLGPPPRKPCRARTGHNGVTGRLAVGSRDRRPHRPMRRRGDPRRDDRLAQGGPMLRRLYWLLPNVESARRTADDLLLARIEDRHMHFLARRGTDLANLHEASYLQKTDTVHGAFVGLVLGGLTGILGGIVMMGNPPAGIQMEMGIVFVTAAVGAG